MEKIKANVLYKDKESFNIVGNIVYDHKIIVEVSAEDFEKIQNGDKLEIYVLEKKG